MTSIIHRSAKEAYAVWIHDIRKYLLMACRGRGSAATSKELASAVGIPWSHDTEPMVRRIIKELRFGGLPVCSDTHKPPGYFLPQTPEELEDYITRLHGLQSAIQEQIEALKSARHQYFKSIGTETLPE